MTERDYTLGPEFVDTGEPYFAFMPLDEQWVIRITSRYSDHDGQD